MGQSIWRPLLLMFILVLMFDLFYNMVAKQTGVTDGETARVRTSWGAELADYVHHNVLATQRLLERYR